jgi:hypothetical protein
MLRVLLLAPLSLAAIACGDDPLPVFIDTQFQISRDFGGGLAGTPRDILNSDGVDGLDLRCSVRPDGSNQVFALNASKGNEFGIELRNVVFPNGGGGLVGTSCVFVLRDGDNTYSGSCGSGQPAGHCVEDPRETPGYDCVQPCRVFDISVGNGMHGPQVALKYYCQGLGLATAPTTVVEVSANGNGRMAQDFPASLAAANCDGLAQE